jgi:hypothetical protein
LLWSTIQLCEACQERHLLTLVGILGQVYLDEGTDAHLRAGALKTLHVLLQRGETFVGQFVHHRDALATKLMEHVRTYEHTDLVHGDGRSENCMMKYASFTLISAVSYGNKDQLIRLLETGMYPLLFKIIALEGEEDKPEEAKLRAARALQRLLEVCNEEVVVQQERAVGMQFDAEGSWDVVRSLLNEGEAPDAKDDMGSDGEDSNESVERSEDELRLRWSEELRDCVSAIATTAQRLGLFA